MLPKGAYLERLSSGIAKSQIFQPLWTLDSISRLFQQTLFMGIPPATCL